MIIVRLIGGLGNQMFEYAAAYVAAKHSQTELKIDLLYFLDTTKRRHLFEYRPYSLSLFNIGALVASPREIGEFVVPRTMNKYFYCILNRLHKDKNVYRESNLNNYYQLTHLPSENAYIDGLFQKFSYFKNDLEDIKKEFTFKEKLPDSHKVIANNITTEQNAVCIVFRRGDYVNHPILGIITLEYYYQALNVLSNKRENLSLFVFSDDINWCMQNFKPAGYTPTFVDQKYTGLLAGNYLQLMMLCSHFIIPNSTYPYWAALLSEHNLDKIVIAPKVWYKGQDKSKRNEILPPDWIVI